MLVSMRTLLEEADKCGYAQGAFNVNAECQVEAAIKVHEMLRSPALLQGAELSNGYMGGRCDFMNSTLEDKKEGMKNIVSAVRKYGENSPIPIALNLDHGLSFETCKAAIDAGYTSVMIDGSSLPFEENMELTREVVKYAKTYGVTVEGELGVLAGVEDHVFSENSTYTNPLDAIEFFKKTGADALAISYGTMHGANKGKNAIIRKEIEECMRHERIDGFLVSHGSSTVPKYIVDEINTLGGDLTNFHGMDIKQLIEVSKCGMNKVNVDTDIRLSVTRNVKELFAKDKSILRNPLVGEIYKIIESNKKAFDPRAYLTPIMDTVMYGDVKDEDVRKVVNAIELGVQEVLGTLIVQFGSVGHAGCLKNWRKF